MSSIAPQTALYHGRRVTVDEYFELPEDGHKYDMIDGVLYLAASGEFGHTRAFNKFFGELYIFEKQTEIGTACSEQDIDLGDGGDVVRPDVCFFLGERDGLSGNRITRIPDLVAEALSPSTRKKDLGIKADRYLRAGVREYWLLDHRADEIHLWLNQDGTWAKSSGKHFESRLLPGFRVDADLIFA